MDKQTYLAGLEELLDLWVTKKQISRNTAIQILRNAPARYDNFINTPNTGNIGIPGLTGAPDIIPFYDQVETYLRNKQIASTTPAKTTRNGVEVKNYTAEKEQFITDYGNMLTDLGYAPEVVTEMVQSKRDSYFGKTSEDRAVTDDLDYRSVLAYKKRLAQEQTEHEAANAKFESDKKLALAESAGQSGAAIIKAQQQPQLASPQGAQSVTSLADWYKIPAAQRGEPVYSQNQPVSTPAPAVTDAEVNSFLNNLSGIQGSAARYGIGQAMAGYSQDARQAWWDTLNAPADTQQTRKEKAEAALSQWQKDLPAYNARYGAQPRQPGFPVTNVYVDSAGNIVEYAYQQPLSPNTQRYLDKIRAEGKGGSLTEPAAPPNNAYDWYLKTVPDTVSALEEQIANINKEQPESEHPAPDYSLSAYLKSYPFLQEYLKLTPQQRGLYPNRAAPAARWI